MSFSSKSRIQYFLFLVTVVALILHQSVEANLNLIQVECQNAENPTMCIECLQSFNSSLNTSPERIATNVLGCLRKRVHKVALGFSQFSTTAHDNKTALALKDCHKFFSTVIAGLMTAIEKALAGDWKGAEAALVTAIISSFKCRFKLEKTNGVEGLPIDFKYEMLAVDQLFDAATRIVERRL